MPDDQFDPADHVEEVGLLTHRHTLNLIESTLTNPEP